MGSGVEGGEKGSVCELWFRPPMFILAIVLFSFRCEKKPFSIADYNFDFPFRTLLDINYMQELYLGDTVYNRNRGGVGVRVGIQRRSYPRAATITQLSTCVQKWEKQCFPMP